MLPDVIKSLLISFVATVGFAGMLHAPVRSWIPASLIGSAIGAVVCHIPLLA